MANNIINNSLGIFLIVIFPYRNIRLFHVNLRVMLIPNI